VSGGGAARAAPLTMAGPTMSAAPPAVTIDRRLGLRILLSFVMTLGFPWGGWRAQPIQKAY
jgi:hypothetical protein